MINSASGQVIATRVTPQLAQEKRAVKPLVPRSAVHLLNIGREMVILYATHADVILVCSLIGFGGLGILSQSYKLLKGDVQDISVSAVCLAIAGLLVQPLGQGALAWIGLRGLTALPSPISAVFAAIRRWPVLLPGTLLYSLLTFACAIGFPLVAGVDVVSTSNEIVSIVDVPRFVALRSIDAATFGPLHPLADLTLQSRQALTQLAFKRGWVEMSSAEVTHRFAAYVPGVTHDPQSECQIVLSAEIRTAWANAGLRNGWIALTCLALLAAADVLLRFRVVAVMRSELSPAPERGDVLALLFASVRWGLRHVYPLIASAIILRLVMSVIQGAFIILPVAVVESMVLPHVSQIAGMSWAKPVYQLACCTGGMLVSAILAAGCTLYDARLFVALNQKRQRNRPPGPRLTLQ